MLPTICHSPQPKQYQTLPSQQEAPTLLYHLLFPLTLLQRKCINSLPRQFSQLQFVSLFYLYLSKCSINALLEQPSCPQIPVRRLHRVRRWRTASTSWTRYYITLLYIKNITSWTRYYIISLYIKKYNQLDKVLYHIIIYQKYNELYKDGKKKRQRRQRTHFTSQQLQVRKI